MKIIGVDVDDVTANLNEWWLYCYNRDHNDNLTESDIKSWDMGSYTKIGDGIYDYLKYPSLYDGVTPVENAIWGIEELRRAGYRIVFITASTPEQSGRKYQWLKFYNLLPEAKDYIEAIDKSIIKVDYLIDDRPKNVIETCGQGLIFTREWNKDLKGYHRLNDWVDVVRYFKIKEGIF